MSVNPCCQSSEEAVAPKVLIIGAGSCGLLLAQGLQKTRYLRSDTPRGGPKQVLSKPIAVKAVVFTMLLNCTVFEKDQADRFRTRSREWGMSLFWGGEFLDKLLPPELKARLKEVDCDPFYDKEDHSFLQCNGETGEVILNMQGFLPRRVSRRKLRKLLSENIEIQYGKKLLSVEHEHSGRITACFEDGSKAEGSNLVGCDGSRSRVRQLLVGAEKAELVDTGINIMNFPYSYSAEQALALRAIHPIFKVGYLPERNNIYLLSIMDVQDPNKPETWKYQSLMSWKGSPAVDDLQDPAARVKHFRSYAAQYAEPWRTAGTAINDDAILPVDKGLYWMPIEWDNRSGRMTLAGDAAHPMLPHRGQGLNHALQDAAVIVEEMKHVLEQGKTLSTAISDYEAEMRARAGQEVQITLKQAMMSHDWEQLKQSPMFKLGANKQAADAKG